MLQISLHKTLVLSSLKSANDTYCYYHTGVWHTIGHRAGRCWI